MTSQNGQPPSYVIRLYFFSWKVLRKIISFANACFIGFWLGVLKRDTLHSVDLFYYNKIQKYHTEAYNRQGFWKWERSVINTYFRDRSCILVGAAGGGREVLALRQLGYEVDGFECNPRLVNFANTLLQEEGTEPNIHVVPRDECLKGTKIYDGIIVGWGAYMLIQERKQRIAFLKQLRAQAQEQAPILLSFYTRSGKARRFKVIAVIANIFRFFLRRIAVQPGDALAPNYVHYFTEEEITDELREGGFTLAYYSTADYGHAVGFADKTTRTST